MVLQSTTHGFGAKCNAYYLAREGHDVTVVDRQSGPGLETSYANAGEVSPGCSAPWAAPRIPIKAIKWMTMEHSPLVVHARLDPAMWAWSFRMLMNCTAKAYEINKSRMVRLAEYSRDCLMELRAETGIEYDHRARGTLQMLRTQKQLDGTAADMAILDRFGVPYELLDRAGCVNAEPGLQHVSEKIAGGLRLINDETGDCFKFTNALAKKAREIGVAFKYGVAIDGLNTDDERIFGVRITKGVENADIFIVSLGSYSPLLLKPMGIHIPIYPVKGYSITLPVTDPESAPVSTMMDETHKVAVTRLGDRIREAGTAELGGYNNELDERRRRTVAFVASDLFPKGGDVSKSEFW